MAEPQGGDWLADYLEWRAQQLDDAPWAPPIEGETEDG